MILADSSLAALERSTVRSGPSLIACSAAVRVNIRADDGNHPSKTVEFRWSGRDRFGVLGTPVRGQQLMESRGGMVAAAIARVEDIAAGPNIGQYDEASRTAPGRYLESTAPESLCLTWSSWCEAVEGFRASTTFAVSYSAAQVRGELERQSLVTGRSLTFLVHLEGPFLQRRKDRGGFVQVQVGCDSWITCAHDHRAELPVLDLLERPPSGSSMIVMSQFIRWFLLRGP